MRFPAVLMIGCLVLLGSRSAEAFQLPPVWFSNVEEETWLYAEHSWGSSNDSGADDDTNGFEAEAVENTGVDIEGTIQIIVSITRYSTPQLITGYTAAVNGHVTSGLSGTGFGYIYQGIISSEINSNTLPNGTGVTLRYNGYTDPIWELNDPVMDDFDFDGAHETVDVYIGGSKVAEIIDGEFTNVVDLDPDEILFDAEVGQTLRFEIFSGYGQGDLSDDGSGGIIFESARYFEIVDVDD